MADENGAPPAKRGDSIATLGKLTVQELRRLAEQYEAPATGTKPDLLRALVKLGASVDDLKLAAVRTTPRKRASKATDAKPALQRKESGLKPVAA